MTKNINNNATSTKQDLINFVDDIVNCSFDGYGVSGGDIQEIGKINNILTPMTVDQKCSDECKCVEFGFPTICYRKNY